MCERIKRFGVALSVALCVVVGTCNVSGAQEVDGQKILKLFETGIRHYEAGEYADAKSAFDEVLALRPGSTEALQMRTKAEIGQFARMVTNEELAPVAKRLIALMNRALREKKRSVEGIEGMLEDFQSPELATYARALNGIIGYGPFAVPYLLDFLALEGAKNQRIIARTQMAITQMHQDVALPLIEALATQRDLLKMRVAALLGQVGDRRAVPPLLALAQQEGASELVRNAAAGALKNITGKELSELGTAAEAYVHLAEAYLREDTDEVGYFDAERGEIWHWNPEGAALKDKLVYELVPGYLYFPRAGSEVALAGLRLDPQSEPLQGLLLALVTVQKQRCEVFSSDDLLVRLGGEQVSKETKEEAGALLGELRDRWAVMCHLASPGVVGKALEIALSVGDGGASLSLVNALGSKVALKPEAGGKSLLLALDFGDKDVRYNAAIELVKNAPDGSFGEVEKVMHVMGAALKAAAAKNALLVLDDLNVRNILSGLIRQQGVATIECGTDAGRINMSLNLEPAVDIVFLTGNLPEGVFKSVLDRLRADVRTKTVPLCVVIDPRRESVPVEKYEGVGLVLRLGELRAEKVSALLQEQVLQKRQTPLAEEKEALVLRAARALEAVNAAATKYPLGLLEPALLDALRGHSEGVQSAALGALGRFGSVRAVDAAAGILAAEGSSAQLKAVACRAIASVLRRTGQTASAEVVKALSEALGSESEAVREAAAEAMGAAGIPASQMLELIAKYARPAG